MKNQDTVPNQANDDENIFQTVSIEQNVQETTLKLSPDLRSQYLSAVWQNNRIRTKYNHLFEIPLTIDASISLDTLRKKVFHSMPEEKFIDELKNSIYWGKFNPFKVKTK